MQIFRSPTADWTNQTARVDNWTNEISRATDFNNEILQYVQMIGIATF